MYTRVSHYTYIGTKNVAKAVKKVTTGGVKSEGKTWFAQLSDKSKWQVEPLRVLFFYYNMACIRGKVQRPTYTGP